MTNMFLCQNMRSSQWFLISGGTFFARKMRDAKYVTMIDPFTQKFGKWGSLQAVIAAFADILWSAAILGALGSTLQVRYGVVQFQFYDQSNMVHKEGAAKNQMRKTVGWPNAESFFKHLKWGL